MSVEAVVTPAGHIHSGAGLHQEYLWIHVLRNTGRGVKRDRVPDLADIRLRNGPAAQKVAGGVSPIDFKTKLAVMIMGGEADIVEHGRHIKQFGIEPQILLFAQKGTPAEDATGMKEQQVVFGITDELRDIARQLAVGDFYPGNVGHGMPFLPQIAL